MTVSTSPIILALDYNDKKQALDFAKTIDPKFCHLKIGPILFTHYGPDLVGELMALGFSIFLDLKFFDIPQTVYGAVKAAADMGVWMMNVHATGGKAMMEMAREAVEASKNKPILLAVTVLTSLLQSDLEWLGVPGTVEERVMALATYAQQCGMDGVVCSAHEAKVLRKLLGKDFLLVTPGIRLLEDHDSDQKRIKTPKEAMEAGANYIVIGRSVTQSADPLMVLEKIYLSLNL